MVHVLIVDDSQDMCDSMARLLNAAGYVATCAANGRLAMEQVLKQLPDVILLDLLMPEMDGPAFLEVVRSYLRLHSLPVVVLTAYSEGALVERTKSLNVSSILVKGKSKPNEILQAIEKALAHSA